MSQAEKDAMSGMAPSGPVVASFGVTPENARRYMTVVFNYRIPADLDGLYFMHCLPVRRNVAVADAVLDGPRSRVIHEAHNRMVVQMAVLYRLLKG